MKKAYLIWIVFTCLNLILNTSAQSVSCIGAPDSQLVTGEQAQIIADGGSNLRVRPSADATLLAIIPFNEIIPIVEGPFCGDGYAWWQVDYAGERGWVAEGINDFYWLTPYIVQRAQIGDSRIEIQPRLVTTIEIQRLADPARNQFVLTGYPVSSTQIIPFIVIFDERPEPINTTATTTNRTQIQAIADGTRFIEIRFADNATNSEDIALIYRYTATLGDNRYVDAYLPIRVPDLPRTYALPDENQQLYTQQYIEDNLAQVNALDAEAFTPSLNALDGIILSLQYDAPLAMSDLLTYANNGIQLDYHPILTTQITETLIAETDAIPRHIVLNFADYPAGQGDIRIYSTEDIVGNNLITLQQVLQRQSANPPRIPIPSQTDAPVSRDDLDYLAFGSGTGIRYRAIFSDEETIYYSYQGLSDDGNYFISALFALDDDDLPLSLFLDDLISSLVIGGS